MALIGAGEFLDYWTNYRVGAVIGRLRSGKTLLSVALAMHMIDQKVVDGVWANFRHSLQENHSYFRTLFILDEMSKFAEARLSSNQTTEYGRNLGKVDSYLFGGTVYQPDKRLCQIKVRPIAHLPWLDWNMYKWELFESPEVNGVFFLSDPRSYWTWYKSKFIVWSDVGMKKAFKELAELEVEDNCPNCKAHADELVSGAVLGLKAHIHDHADIYS